MALIDATVHSGHGIIPIKSDFGPRLAERSRDEWLQFI
jgi:hypothetical protein